MNYMLIRELFLLFHEWVWTERFSYEKSDSVKM